MLTTCPSAEQLTEMANVSVNGVRIVAGVGSEVQWNGKPG